MRSYKSTYKRFLHYFNGFSKDRSKIAGMLGTLIIHLVIAIIFMLFKIQNLKQEASEMFTVEFQEVEIDEAEMEMIRLPAPSIEKILQGDNEMLNIARNLASRNDPTIDPQDYIDMVKEELIKNGQLSRDNYIDDQKRAAENGEEQLAMESETPKTQSSDKPTESQEMAANYRGPTRIYYDLEGRNHLYLPIPIYLCQGSGKVTLSISVNQKGIVEEARIIPSESTTNDACLVETAVSTAMMSRFNPDVKSPKIQKGTLTYHFVAQ